VEALFAVNLGHTNTLKQPVPPPTASTRLYSDDIYKPLLATASPYIPATTAKMVNSELAVARFQLQSTEAANDRAKGDPELIGYRCNACGRVDIRDLDSDSGNVYTTPCTYRPTMGLCH
jgi:hypothetical protein